VVRQNKRCPFFYFNFEKLIQEVELAPGGLNGKKARKEALKDTLRQIKETYRYEGSSRYYVKIKYLGQPKTTFNTVFEVQEGDVLDIVQTLCQQGGHPLIL